LTQRRDPFDGAFAGRTVLVTGHTGFKGTWLSLWLQELGARVAGFALEPPAEPNLFAQCGLAGRMDSRIGDVREPARLARTLAEVRPEIVFHLAAQSLVRRAHREPVATFATNVMGTVHLLEAMRRAECVRACVVVTSDKCYENLERGDALREEDRLGGSEPYGASKAAAELVVASYRAAFFDASVPGPSTSSVRAGNVLGGGDWSEDRILPDCIRALRQGAPIPVRHPRSVRPWQYVLEPLAGYLWLAARQLAEPAAHAEAWNFGPDAGGCQPVGALVDRVIELWGEPGAKAIHADPGAENAAPEARLLRLDSSKARRRLGWHPVLSLDEVLERTVGWYRRASQDAAFDADRACRDEIARYVETARERGPRWAGGP
jgi:CDP-glucose 4,6-dehydratase